MTTDQPLDLDAIEAVAGAATPGPWGIYESGYVIELAADLEETGHGYRARRVIARLDEEPLDNDPGHREWTAEEDWAQVQADAAYIAAMPPETAKALVAEVRRLRAEHARAQQNYEAYRIGAEGAKRMLSDRLNAVTDLCDQQEMAARMFELPEPEWIGVVREAVELGKPQPAEESHVVAADTDEMAASLRRDGFGDDETADILAPPVVPAATEEQQ